MGHTLLSPFPQTGKGLFHLQMSFLNQHRHNISLKNFIVLEEYIHLFGFQNCNIDKYFSAFFAENWERLAGFSLGIGR